MTLLFQKIINSRQLNNNTNGKNLIELISILKNFITVIFVTELKQNMIKNKLKRLTLLLKIFNTSRIDCLPKLIAFKVNMLFFNNTKS